MSPKTAPISDIHPGTYSFEFRPKMLSGVLRAQTSVTCRCGARSDWEENPAEVLLWLADHEDEEHR